MIFCFQISFQEDDECGGSFSGRVYFVISVRSLNLQIVFVLCSLDCSSSLYIAFVQYGSMNVLTLLATLLIANCLYYFFEHS